MNQRRKLQVEVVELKGDAYQIGAKQGCALQGKGDMYHSDADMTEGRKLLNEISPSLLAELAGLANRMGMDLNTAIQFYGGYDIQMPSMGCTTLANRTFYVRNYDFSNVFYDSRLVLIQPNKGYASIGFSQQVIGRLDGMNEKGLVVGLHLVNEKVEQKGMKGFLVTTICRLILDQCATTEEAVTLLNQVPHQYCYNFSIMDKEGNNAIVESSPEAQVVHYHPELICTNHFESERLKNKNRAFIDISLRRKKYLETLEKENLTPISAYHIFNNERSPLFFKHYKEYFGTLHTVVYCPQDLSVILGIGGDCDPYVLSFNEWLSGDAVLPHILEGTIEG
jgi:predicted choloylglycine hydrolase